MREDQAAGLIAPDRSVTIWTGEDGWSIARLATAGDVRREAYLIRNCLAKYVGDTLDDERMWVTAERSPMADEAPMGLLDQIELRWHELPDVAQGMDLHSLRDDQGVPHLTFWAEQGIGAFDLYGSHNCTAPDDYTARVEQWAVGTGTLLAATGEHRHELIVAVNARRSTFNEIPDVEAALAAALDSEAGELRGGELLTIARDALAALWDMFVVLDGREAFIELCTTGSKGMSEEIDEHFKQRLRDQCATYRERMKQLHNAAGSVCNATRETYSAGSLTAR